MALRRVRAVGVRTVHVAIPVFVFSGIADLFGRRIWIRIRFYIRIHIGVRIRIRVGSCIRICVGSSIACAGVRANEEHRGVVAACGEQREKAPIHDILWERPGSPRYTSGIVNEFNKLCVPETASNPTPSRVSTLAAILSSLRESVTTLEAQAAVARDEATSDESRQESKYDTRAIEAGYLAGAQSRRMMAVVDDLKRFAALPAESNGSDIVDGPSLVGLRREDEQTEYFFVGPGAAGLKVDVDGVRVMLITPSAPLGKALIGAEVGDETPYGEIVLVE